MVHEEIEVGVMVVPRQVVKETSTVAFRQTERAHEDLVHD
jgi:hypothetical protein